MSAARLLLVDDYALVVDGLRKLLEPEFTVVETVGDGIAAVEAFERLKPDLLLLDISLPLMNGIEVARQIKQAYPTALILIVTAHSERVYVEEALAVGAAGYVLKQASARELVDAIHTVLAGSIYLSPWIVEHVGTLQQLSKAAPMQGPLTRRQQSVLQLISEGKTMKEIGRILGISARTVEFHKNAIADHLGLRSTAEMTRYALAHRDGGAKHPGRSKSTETGG